MSTHVNIKKLNTVGKTLTVEAGSDKANAVIVYTDKYENWPNRCPKLNSAHPDYPDMQLIRVESDEEDGGMVRVKLTYESWASQFGEPETKIYDCDVTTSEEHLLTHPRYDPLSKIERKALLNISNGTESNENNMLFESQVKSDIGKEALAKIRKGITHYLVPGMIWRQRFTARTLSSLDIADVGNIDSPPGGAPSGGSRNWLYIGATASGTADGRFWTIEKQWRLSGRGGWDEQLYND